MSAPLVTRATTASGIEMPTATCEHVTAPDGVPIAVWTSGEGPPLVMVHGAMADHTTLARLLPLLEPAFTVHAVDRRGRGTSGDGPNYAVEREFADIATVVDTIAARTARQVFLYGHSFGATCALGAARLTTNLAGLVLYEPAFAGVFAYPPAWLDRLEALVAAGASEQAVILALQHRAGVTPTQLDAMRSAPSWPARVAAAGTLPRELRVDERMPFRAAHYSGLEVPSLLLLGEHSPPGQRAIVEAVAAALPRSQIAVLPGQQHLAQLAAPDLLADQLIRFRHVLRT